MVYYLFGRANVVPKYVVGEEDILEWLAALQDPEKRPKRLFDELGRNHLLFLGCGYPDWLARFILRTAKNSKLSADRDFGEYLIDARASKEDSFVIFLRSFSRGTQILPLDAARFVAEFERRWRERRQAGTTSDAGEQLRMPESMPPGSIFISYAREDLPAALQIASDLQAKGLPVWLDRDKLDWGTDFELDIRRAIRQCSLFLPVLSSAAARRVGSFFRKEWNWAKERSLDFTGSSLRFLFPFPLVIDDLNVFKSPDIDEAFKVAHIESAPGGHISEAQQSAIAAACREMRARMEYS